MLNARPARQTTGMTWQIYVLSERKSAPATLGQEVLVVKSIAPPYLASSVAVESPKWNEADRFPCPPRAVPDRRAKRDGPRVLSCRSRGRTRARSAAGGPA